MPRMSHPGVLVSRLFRFFGIASTSSGVEASSMNHLRIFMLMAASGIPASFGRVQRLVPLGHAGGFRLQHGGSGGFIQNPDVLDLVSPDDGIDDVLAF